VHAREPVVRERDHAERIGVAQFALRGEGKLRQIAQFPAIVRPHAGGVELGAIAGHVLVCVAQGLPQALELQRSDFVARGDLDRV
jgi:hypothetical protein